MSLDKIEKILFQYGRRWRKDLRQSMKRNRKNATGKTSKAIAFKIINKTRLQIIVPTHMLTLTQPTIPKPRAKVSDIQKWINARGLNLNAVAVTKKLNRVGTSPRFTAPNLFSDAINEKDISILVNDVADVADEVLVSTIDDSIRILTRN